MRKLSLLFLALALLLSLLPVVAPAHTARAATPPTVTLFPILPYTDDVPIIAGTVTDLPEGNIIDYVKVRLTRLTDNLEWNGAAWLTAPQWADAVAADGNFNSHTEGWILNAMPLLEDGKCYRVTAIEARDMNADTKLISPNVQFCYDDAAPTGGINVISPSPGDDLNQVSGTASDSPSKVAMVQVKVQRDSDNKYLNLHAGVWQVCEVWNSAAADDGAFNEYSENWKLDVAAVAWIDGVTYTFTARAADGAGNVGLIGARDFMCDRDFGENLGIDIHGGGVTEGVPYWVDNIGPPVLTLTGSSAADHDLGYAVDKVEVRIKKDPVQYWDGADWGIAALFLAADPSDGDFDTDNEGWEYTTLPSWEDGESYTIDAKVTDNHGSPHTADAVAERFTIDSTPPTVGVIDVGDGFPTPIDITGSAGDDAVVAGVQVSIQRLGDNNFWNGLAWQDVAVWLQATDTGTPDFQTWRLNTLPQWQEGLTYEITAVAVDGAGHCSAPGPETSDTFICGPVGALPTATPTPTPTATAQVVIEAPALVGKGSTFTAKVRLNGVTNFDHAQYQVKYKATVLEVTAVSAGSKDTTPIPVTAWALVPAGTQGVVSVTNDLPGVTGLSGNMILAELTFKVVGDIGQKSDIEFVTANSKLWDTGTPTALQIPARWTKFGVEVQAATAGPTPTPTRTPTATPTTQVVIDVAAAKVDEDGNFSAVVRLYRAQNFDSAQYRVKYDPTVIEVTGVSDGAKGTTAITVTSSSLVPAGTQGVFSIVNDVAGTAGLSGDMILANIHFHVVGAAGKKTDIEFVTANSKLFNNAATPAEIPAGWKKDSVEVKSLVATPTPTTTSNATATPTASPTPGEDGGSPGWLWPLVGILIALTLVFAGLALYKTGYLAKLGHMWGATEEDFLVDDMKDEDLYDAMYSGEEEEEL